MPQCKNDQIKQRAYSAIFCKTNNLQIPKKHLEDVY